MFEEICCPLCDGEGEIEIYPPHSTSTYYPTGDPIVEIVACDGVDGQKKVING